ncbi:VOC family protein [Streptomyces sp. NPDC003393]
MATLRPRGVNHLAIPVGDMKEHLEFWCDVLGMPLKALFWMHAADGVYHAFVEMSPNSYISLVEDPRNGEKEHLDADVAGGPLREVVGSAVHHIAMDVETEEDVLAMRDRIRSKGIQVLGPIDHGWWKSIYFAGPDNCTLEITTGGGVQPEDWVDPEVAELCGISPEELKKLENPEPFEATGTPVPQPDEAPSAPRMFALSKEFDLDKIMLVSDQDILDTYSETRSPMALKNDK